VDWLSPSFARLLAAALLALVPAAHTWWRGRRLSRLLGDPALPERLITGNHQRGVITGAAFALGCFIGGRHALWLVPMMIAAQMAAAHPLRKAIYGETWSPAGYLSFFARLYIAVPGLAARRVGPSDGARRQVRCLDRRAASWSASSPGAPTVEAAGWIVGVTPITDSDLVARFDRVSRGRPPIALGWRRCPARRDDGQRRGPCSLRGSSVCSLTRCGTSQRRVRAIAAHEVAHLEHFNPKRLRRLRWLTGAVIVGCAAVSLVQLGSASVLPVAWAVAVIIGLALPGPHAQAHETKSDLRAVSLTGNPDALVNALAKLHALALMPRRWDRIRAARHASQSRVEFRRFCRRGRGASRGHAIEATFGGATSGTSVAFDPARVTWLERDGMTHSASYETLVESCVAAAGSSAPTLNRRRKRPAVDIPLGPDDVLRAQAVLDAVDTRLARPTAHAVHSSIARLGAVLFAVVALAAAHWGALVVALVTLVTPAPAPRGRRRRRRDVGVSRVARSECQWR
jgi:hypothetical protein